MEAAEADAAPAVPDTATTLPEEEEEEKEAAVEWGGEGEVPHRV